MASPELEALIEELSRLEEPESIDEERRAWDTLCASLDPVDGVTLEGMDAGGVPAMSLTPPVRGSMEILYCHGGAFALGSAWNNRGMLSRLAGASAARVVAIDYRLAPEHPYPAALEDTGAAYRWLLETGVDPASIVLAGDSCGANLILGAAIGARDLGEPLPAAVICLSPWVDLTLSGESLEENAEKDGFITRESLVFLGEQYLDGADPADPRASPLFADLGSLPPLLIQVGSEEAVLSDSFALAGRAAAAGVSVTLEVVPEVVHVWQVWAGQVPESLAAVARIAEFATNAISGRTRT